ncbi:acyl carrier protein [Singulisphaera sp. GP187]|uniref:hypothetical protein n=1 Tax=Singulisphaera sp. GP187 TaxID=1882752 RepID=UPI0009297D0C|nr:hypothetical protein [Singulisphaera sp. GP187]SIO66468.1 acyl carrier protein [Singulisphaera sp. GP187]
MGLDTVELVIETEQTFGIKINDRDAEQITTVGGLYRYVLTKLEGQESPSPTCKSAAVFYRIRRALGETLGIERDRVRPSTDIEDLIASNGRRRAWNELRNTLNLDLPGLVYPDWVGLFQFGAFLLGLVTAVASFTPALPAEVAPWSLLVSFSLLSTVLILGYMDSIAVSFPAGCHSVRGLVFQVVALNYGNMMATARQWNAHEVWEALRILVGQQAGVDPDELTEDTSFVADLGLD